MRVCVCVRGCANSHCCDFLCASIYGETIWRDISASPSCCQTPTICRKPRRQRFCLPSEATPEERWMTSNVHRSTLDHPIHRPVLSEHRRRGEGAEIEWQQRTWQWRRNDHLGQRLTGVSWKGCSRVRTGHDSPTRSLLTSSIGYVALFVDYYESRYYHVIIFSAVVITIE